MSKIQTGDDEHNPYKPSKYEIAGFELVGYRQSDGKVRLGDRTNGTVMDHFPEYVEVNGVTYTLEGYKWQNGSDISWGTYV